MNARGAVPATGNIWNFLCMLRWAPDLPIRRGKKNVSRNLPRVAVNLYKSTHAAVLLTSTARGTDVWRGYTFCTSLFPAVAYCLLLFSACKLASNREASSRANSSGPGNVFGWRYQAFVCCGDGLGLLTRAIVGLGGAWAVP
jgi:hypothetical protein